MSNQPDLKQKFGARRDEFLAAFRYEGVGIPNMFRGLSNFISNGAPREIREDWLRLYTIKERLKGEYFKDAPADEQDLTSSLEKLALIEACLRAAQLSTNSTEGWRFVNRAAYLLARLSNDPDDLGFFLSRYLSIEPVLVDSLKMIYDPKTVEDMNGLRIEAFKAFESNPANKQLLLELLGKHLFQWELVDQAEGFKRRLSRFITLSLFFIALFVVVLMIWPLQCYYAPAGYDTFACAGDDPIPIYYIIPFALLGGATSALFNARELRPTAINYRQSVRTVMMRMVIGGVGGLIVFAIFTIPGFLTDDLVKLFSCNLSAFIALGFAGGYSEQFFRGAIDRLVSRVSADDKKKDGA